MIHLKSMNEINKMRESNGIVAEALLRLSESVRPGITTYDLDQMAEEFIHSKGGKPAFKGYRGFPSTLCVSVNEEVVHGIPSRQRRLENGDIVSIDCGVLLDGFFGDAAITVPVGEVSPEAERLIEVAWMALEDAIAQIRPGNRVGDVSHAVQSIVEKNGFSIVRDFVGHGIGRSLHEEPQIPNFGDAGLGPRLKEGMVLAVEPMINVGTHEVKVLEDGWTAVTIDGKLSAHVEHSVAVTAQGPMVLSRLDS